MAHQVEQMAYVGRTPWHGLGNKLPEQQPLEVWMEQAGLDWTIHETPVRFINGNKGHLGRSSPSMITRCCTARILMPRCPWSASAIRWCNPGRSWSSTATSPRSPALSWRLLVALKAAARSGHWPEPARAAC